MMQSVPVKKFACAALLVIHTGCASIGVSSRSQDTADLGEVAADIQALAEVVGRDEVLAVFDIDNTLLAMEQSLGSDQWYEWQKETTEQEPCDHRLVSNRLAVQGAMYFASAMRPTQPNGPEIIRSIQDSGIRVIALTSRGVDFRLQTFRELRRSGFDLRRSAIGPEAGWDEDFIPVNGIRPARYEDGVFLTTGQHKGAMLEALLNRTNTPLPGAVIMVDDKQANLDAVTETFSNQGVPVHAWLYHAEEEAVSGFDADGSHEMWQQLLPAMQTIQRVLGPDNYELPAHNAVEDCSAAQDG